MPTRQYPPAPPARFFSGHLREVRQDLLGFYTRAARQYGDVVTVRFGPKRLYLVSHPDLIEEVLVHKARSFIKHYAVRMNRLVLGDGLLSSEGGLWLRQRRLTQPAFTRERIAAYSNVFVDFAERLLAGWRDGMTRDVYEDMADLALEIIAKTLFDADVRREADDIGAALTEAQNSFIARFRSIIPLPEWLPLPVNFRLRRAVRRLDEILFRIIRHRHESGQDPGDLLSMLLHARDEDGSRMSDKQLRDEAMTLFLAGHETTALALSWTWHALAENPEVDAKLYAELRDVLGDRPPALEDLPRLRYTERVILEAMRLYPPAYAIGREALAECDLGGYHLPRGQAVLMCQWVVHRDPRFWDNPDKFDPYRWEHEPLTRLPRYAYFPFGGGPRVCIGNHFAMLEATLVLAALARRFRLERADSNPIGYKPSLTLRPAGPIRMTLRAR